MYSTEMSCSCMYMYIAAQCINLHIINRFLFRATEKNTDILMHNYQLHVDYMYYTCTYRLKYY